MKKYPLRIVLWVRRNAEEKMLHFLNVARAEEKKAETELQSRESELKEFLAWRDSEEARLLTEVLGRPIANRLLMGTLEQISWNASQEPRFQKRVEEARNVRKTRVSETATATENYQAAAREVMKLEAHERQWRELAAREEENAETSEIEEVSETLYNFRRGLAL